MLRRTITLLTAAAAVLAASTVALASEPKNPKWQSSGTEGTWQHDGYLLQNDMWSCPQAACGRQTIWANSQSDWGVSSNMAAGNTAVLTYPDVGMMFGDKPVSSFRSIHNEFTESMPRHAKGLSAEAADDVWFNHWNIEMMIWVDNVGRSLAGGTRIGKATIFGQHFSVWKYGSSEFIFDLNHNETSGGTHILASVHWLMKHGFVPSNATFTEAEFGWEIASTGGHARDFEVTKYWLHSKKR